MVFEVKKEPKKRRFLPIAVFQEAPLILCRGGRGAALSPGTGCAAPRIRLVSVWKV